MIDHLLKRSWVIPVIYLGLAIILFLTDLIWFIPILISIGIITLLIQIYKRKWLEGFLTLVSLIIITILVLMWIKGQSETRSTPSALHSSYTLYYENEDWIENLIGVDLPKYVIRGNKIIHDNYLTNWIGIETFLRFDSVLEPSIYVILDSLCNLSIPKEIPDNTSLLYINKGTIKRCWKRDNTIYQYRREAPSNDQFMKESGDYFYFTLNKEDSIGRLVYGNNKIFHFGIGRSETFQCMDFTYQK